MSGYDSAAASSLPGPPDDPAEVAAAATVVAATATSVGASSDRLARHRAAMHPSWHSRDGDAALAEVGRLSSYSDRGTEALHTAVSALRAYEHALADARGRILRLRNAYADALSERDRQLAAASRACGTEPSEMANAHVHSINERARTATAALHGQRRWVDLDLATASARSAAAIREATRLLHVAPRRSTVIAMLRSQLPVWHDATARAAAARAASQFGSGDRTPEQLAAVMARYDAWRDDPTFAVGLLGALGVERYRRLLMDNLPAAYLPTEQRTIDRVYGFLGAVLAAGSRDPARLPAGWLDRLMHGVGASAYEVRRGLGLALRHGLYGEEALHTIVPTMLRASSDLGDVYDAPVDYDDPVVGALTALATNGAATRRVLSDLGTVEALLDRPWPQDHGAALGAAIAAVGGPHTPAGVRAAEAIVAGVGRRAGKIPAASAAGLGTLLGDDIEDVNLTLPDPNGDATTAFDVRPLALSGGPHAKFDRVALAHALFAAMRSSSGSAQIYAHQAAYAATLFFAKESQHAARALHTIAKNYGRLAEIHQTAVLAQARAADAVDNEQLQNRLVWIRMAATIVGAIPLPKLPMILAQGAGQARGLGTSWVADRLTRKFFGEPLGSSFARHRSAALHIAHSEEVHSKLFVNWLARAAERDGRAGWGEITAEVSVSDAFQAGQRDVTDSLLPRMAR